MKNPVLQIMWAQPADAPLLKEICLRSKGHWGYPEHLMTRFARTPIITRESMAEDLVGKGIVGGKPAGWYRLQLRLPHAFLEDLWILPEFMGRGIGRALFHHLAAQAWTRGAAVLELDADPNAAAFYERLGCTVIGNTLSEWGRLIPRMRCDLPLETSNRGTS